MEVRSTGLKKKRWKKISWMEIPKRVNISTNQENTSYIYLYPFLFHSLCFYPTLCANKVLIWSWRLCSSDIDMTEYKVWYKFFLASFHETTCSFLIKHFFIWFICEVFDFAYIIPLTYIFKSVHLISEWFHLLSDNTGKIWVEAYFQIEIRVKFILKLRVCLGWLPLFTHIEFWWHEKFL